MASRRPDPVRSGAVAAVVEGQEFEIVLWPRSALLEGNGRAQFPIGSTPWAFWGWLAPVLFLAAVGAAFVWAVQHIESTIESTAAEVLLDSGIDPTGLAFTANYRDLEISGDISGAVSTGEIEMVLESSSSSRFAVRNAVFVAERPIDGVREFSPISVEATSDGEVIALTGTVPSQDHEDAIMAAAIVTGQQVINNLTVSGLAPDAEDPQGQIDAFAEALALLTPETVSAGVLEIRDVGPVTGDIMTTTPEAASIFEAVTGDGITVTSPPLLLSLIHI